MQQTFTITAEVEIRPCTARDLPQMEWYGLFTPHREIIERTYARQKKGEMVMLVAEMHHYPVGQVWIDLMQPEPGVVGTIWALRVLPFMQGLGIGLKLIAAAERELTVRGFQGAEIAAELGARVAQLYRRLGYEPMGERVETTHYTTPDGVPETLTSDVLVFRKPLSLILPETPSP